VGFVARTMHAYGLRDLRLVGVPPPDPKGVGREAYWTARSGEEVLRGARYFDSLPPALADCRQALAFTRRPRDTAQWIFDLPEIQARYEGRLDRTHARWAALPAPGLPTALLFGRESKGLTQEDTLQATHVVRIPLAPGALSLNLSHAAAIALYALCGGGLAAEEAEAVPERATLAESQAALNQVLEVLNRNGFLSKGKKEATRVEKTRLLWQRLQPTRREVDFLCGALRALAEKVDA
jgi:TrmH family RNA methyltransferase